MKLALVALMMVSLTGCGGSNEVVYPDNPTPTPPPGSLSTAEEPGMSGELTAE